MQFDDAVAEVRRGSRLIAVFADDPQHSLVLHYVFDRDGALVDLPVAAADSVSSLTSLLPGASWHEREARDLYGVTFDGLDDELPLVDIPEAERVKRVRSDEVSTVLYGPVRSGVVESARWTIETGGEDFVHVTPSMFFKRRALERRFAGTPIELCAYVAEYASGATAASHASAFSKAVERALSIEVPPRARAARAVLVEFERVHQHLDALAKLADDGSLSVGSAQLFAAKERVHRLLAAATGHRFSRGVVCPGGTRDDVMAGLQREARAQLDAVERHATSAVERLFATPSLMDRLIGAGRLSRDAVVAYCGVGPVARGNGVRCDCRTSDGYLFTPLRGEEALQGSGDAFARAQVRREEIYRSFQLLRNALDGTHEGPWLADAVASSGEGMARVESPQGELFYFARIVDGVPARVAIRSASYANWPLFATSLPGNIFTDFSFIEHSFGALQAEVDR